MSSNISRAISVLNYIIEGTDMGYTSFVFLACLAAFFPVFFLLRGNNSKRLLILTANLVFYIWAGSFGAFMIICATGAVVYLASLRMEKIYGTFDDETKNLTPRERNAALSLYKKRTIKILWLALFAILAVWIYVKTGKYFRITAANGLRDFRLFKTVIVPLGISYYSLSSIGYLLDVYWRKVRPERDFLTLFAAMTYFPHIVQGPISRYGKLISQMNAIPKFDYRRFCFGLQLMTWGYVKKLVVADRLALFTGKVFAEPTKYAGFEILITIILSVFQLYADFSGCMDIVRGISESIGIELDQNFRQPFFSKSAAEFWRRWHMTLGGWMKDYVYFPIATNPRFMKWTSGMRKRGKAHLSSFLKIFVPTAVVWFLTGLWHGTGMDYILWGAYWCALIVLSSELKLTFDRLNSSLGINTESRSYLLCQMLRTFALFAIGRTFTAAGGLVGCKILWLRLFSGIRLFGLLNGSFYKPGGGRKEFAVAVLGIIVMMVVDLWHERGIKIREKIASLALPLRWAIYYACIVVVLIFGIYGIGYDAASFIYGAF